MKNIFFTIVLLFLFNLAFGQSGNLNRTVTNGDGQAAPYVSVLIEGN